MHLIRIKGSLPHIERFHSRGKHLCKFIGTKKSVLHKKRVQLPKDFLGTPTWPPFHCFGTPIWPPWGHVKTLNIALKAITVECNAGTLEMNYFWLVYLSYVQTDATTPNVRSWWNNVPSVCTGLKVWPVSNFAKQLPTTSSNMQQGVQTDATCKIQQCCVLLQGA